jgi:hypothetical protein
MGLLFRFGLVMWERHAEQCEERGQDTIHISAAMLTGAMQTQAAAVTGHSPTSG